MASKEKKLPEKRDDSGKSEIMHRLKTHPFLFIGTVIILIIVIIAFVFVPAIVPRAHGMEDLTFGFYNKVPIKYVSGNYFYQVQQRLANQYQMPSPDDPSYFMIIQWIWRRAFEETVIYMGIQDEMKEAGFITPENVVDREVAKQFQENGKFSATRYRAMSTASQTALWRQVQESIVAGHYMSDLFGLRTASAEATFISSMASPRRSFELAVFPFSSYPDSEVVSFAEANQALFRITRLSRITINSGEREARQILDLVKNNTSTFEEAARTNSQDEYAEKDGDMGIRMAFELIPEISDEQARESVINLSRGSLSDLVRVSTGWAFFRAEEAVQPADTGDPAQRDKIRSYIMNNLRGRAEDWLTAEAEKFIAQVREKGFQDAVSNENVIKQSFGPIPVNYGSSALFSTVESTGIPELRNASTNQFFWRAAFSTPLESPSNPFVFENSVMVLYPVEESDADESTIEQIESYYPYRTRENMDQAFRTYFLSNEKLDDHFDETFGRLWRIN